MPYKSEKIKLSPTQDRRRKLTDKQKELIKELALEFGAAENLGEEKKGFFGGKKKK